MTTPLEAKLAFHRELSGIFLAERGTGIAGELDKFLLAGYAEIDRLFAESKPNGSSPMSPVSQFSNPLADDACPTAGINCDRGHVMAGGSVVHREFYGRAPHPVN